MPEPVQQTVDQCDGCKFMRTRVYGADTVLECRRNPPQLNFRWPRVIAEDWCGEFVASTVHATEA